MKQNSFCSWVDHVNPLRSDDASAIAQPKSISIREPWNQIELAIVPQQFQNPY